MSAPNKLKDAFANWLASLLIPAINFRLSMLQPRLFWPLSLLPLLLAGCSDSPYDGRNMAEPRPIMTVLKEAAAETLKARAVGNIRDAARRHDQNAMRRGYEELARADQAGKPTQEAVEVLVGEANALIGLATDYFSDGRELDDETRARLLLKADTDYRLALKFYPGMATQGTDRDVLNSIGYHLADRGKTQEDFRLAETLTRRAVRLWDTQIRQSAAGNSEELEQLRVRRAQEPLDSLAWALFRQGRYREAKPLAEEVLRTVRQTAGGFNVDAALPFHMAEIYRALGEHEAARREYEVALRVAPSPEIEAKIKRAVAAMQNVETETEPVKTPQPTALGIRP